MALDGLHCYYNGNDYCEKQAKTVTFSLRDGYEQRTEPCATKAPTDAYMRANLHTPSGQDCP